MRQAEAAFAWRTVDAELASLAYDSLLDDGIMFRARARVPRRTIIFERDQIRIELEVTPEGVVGQLTPADTAEVVLEGLDGVIDETTTDESGSFVVDAPVVSPVRLRVSNGGSQLVTDWIGLTPKP